MRIPVLPLSLLLAAVSFASSAAVEPSALFTDHAVLRRSKDTPVFGFAAPGEEVSVALGAAKARTKADGKGAWLVRLDLHDAPATPQTLVINDVRAEDVLVGETWLCSGQSNMSFPLSCADDAGTENGLTNAMIRCFQVTRRDLLSPDPRIAGRWLRDVPDEKLGMSAIGYHFAKRLQAVLGGPVGIVNSSVGASTLEAWCDRRAMEAFPEGRNVLERQIAFMDGYRDYEKRCRAELRAWEEKWNRADRPHGAAPAAGWRELTQDERDVALSGPGAVWVRRTLAPRPDGLVVSRRCFLERQWVLDRSSAEFYFNGRRLECTYPVSPSEKNVELYDVPSAEAAKGGVLEVRYFSATKVFAALHYLSVNGRMPELGGWRIAEEFRLPPVPAAAVADQPKPQRYCLSQHYPCILHNGMIAGLVPMGLSGVVWYQGESNAAWSEASSGPEDYTDLFRGFVKSWRDLFGRPELPFVWCQLASYTAKATDANEGSRQAWVALRAAQQRALDLPMTGQAVLIDAGEAEDIHPRDKRTPGRRTADWALNRVYGRPDVVCRGPHATGASYEAGRAKVMFADCGAGLKARDLGAKYLRCSKRGSWGEVRRNSPATQVEGFAVAGEDGVWHWADEAVIRGDAVEVSAKDVPKPVAVRYGWSLNPWVNLYNSADLPAEPFEFRPASR